MPVDTKYKQRKNSLGNCETNRRKPEDWDHRIREGDIANPTPDFGEIRTEAKKGEKMGRMLVA
jgi:hypothetical protein